MQGDPFLTSDFIYVDPFIKPLPEVTGGYQLFYIGAVAKPLGGIKVADL